MLPRCLVEPRRRALVPETSARSISCWFARYLAAPERTQTYLIRQLSFPNLSTLSQRKSSTQEYFPVRGWVLEAPELWARAFETKANFGSAALPFAYVNDSAILLLASGGISQDKLLAQSDRYGQSNEATVSTEHDSARGICKWTFVGQFAVHDHR